nr:alpha/beta hydrolase [Chromobacterium sp. ASV5]
MQRFELAAADGCAIHGARWLPDLPPRAVVLIAHGMSEYATRYARLAARLAAEGYAVYAHDHRGHGPHARTRGWFAAVDGWRKVVDDVETVRSHASGQHPGVKTVLLGHSMGSFIARAYFLRYGDKLSGLALSATGYRQRPLARLLRGAARLAGRLGGRDRPSRFMAALIFGSFNLGFLPARTRMDWLSRDASEVDAYLADPLCGFEPAPGLWVDLFGGIIELENGEAAGQGLNRRCPVWLLAGSRDPVSLGRLGLGQLEIRYRGAGLADVVVSVYPGGRHEMFNESNRAEVEADLLAWLARAAARGQAEPGSA